MNELGLDTSRCRKWVVGAIQAAPLELDPYPHFVADDVLPPDLFDALAADLPAVSDLVPNAMWKVMEQYANRYYRALDEVPGFVRDPGPWETVRQALDHPDVTGAIAERFEGHIPGPSAERLRAGGLSLQLALQADETGSWLSPHTDSPSLFAPGVLYIRTGPSGVDPSAGTTVFVPRDAEARAARLGPDYTRQSYAHEDPADHVEAGRVDFKPNRLFVFLRSFTSLHGLSPIQPAASPRYTMLVHPRYGDLQERPDAETRSG